MILVRVLSKIMLRSIEPSFIPLFLLLPFRSFLAFVRLEENAMADDKTTAKSKKQVQAEWDAGEQYCVFYPRLAADELISHANEYIDNNTHRDPNGCTQLHFSALLSRFSESDQSDLLATLDVTTDINARNRWGQTALHFSLCGGSVNDFLTALLQRANLAINARDEWGQTPLHYSAKSWRNSDGICLLLDAGADPSIRDMLGRTPLDIIKAENENLIGSAAEWRLKDALWWQDTDFATCPKCGCRCCGQGQSA